LTSLTDLDTVLWLLALDELLKVVLFLTIVSYNFNNNKQNVTIVTILKGHYDEFIFS